MVGRTTILLMGEEKPKFKGERIAVRKRYSFLRRGRKFTGVVTREAKELLGTAKNRRSV